MLINKYVPANIYVEVENKPNETQAGNNVIENTIIANIAVVILNMYFAVSYFSDSSLLKKYFLTHLKLPNKNLMTGINGYPLTLKPP